jgi:serine/threonine protein kinase
MADYPQRWGDYVLVRPLGSGGMGLVFLALTRRGGLEKLCVVKRLPGARLSDPELLRRFRREADISLTIAHQAIAPTIYAGDHDGEPFIAQEFVEGRTLTQLVSAALSSREHISPRIAAYVGQQVARALAFAHQSRVVHRDIAPNNVMVDFDGGVRLIDFGIARRDDDPSLTASGDFVGRMAYAAPEILSGGTADPRSDIYSLGVLLWELLVGRVPAFEELKAAPKPSGLAPERQIPMVLDQIVVRAIAEDPNARFASADEFERALGLSLPPSFDGKKALAAFIGRCYDVPRQRQNLREEVAEARALLPLPAGADTTEIITSPPPRRGSRIVGLLAFAAVVVAGALILRNHREPSVPTRVINPADLQSVELPASPSPKSAPSIAAPLPVAPTAPAAPPKVTTHAPAPMVARAPTPLKRPSAAVASRTGALLDQARDSLFVGEFNMAERDAQEALEGGTPHQKSAAHLILGRVLVFRGNRRQAADEFGQAIQLDPENGAASDELAALRRRGLP